MNIDLHRRSFDYRQLNRYDPHSADPSPFLSLDFGLYPIFRLKKPDANNAPLAEQSLKCQPSKKRRIPILVSLRNRFGRYGIDQMGAILPSIPSRR